jgi:hypothetical protein
MENRIEFIISKDSQGRDVSLENMPLEAARALKIFLDALTEVANLQTDSSEITLSIKPGSICAELTAPPSQFEEIYNGLDDVINHRSRNKDYVKAYRSVQKTIKANGLGYEVNVIKDNREIPIINSFKAHKEFRVSRGPARQQEVSLEFINGKLIDIGGKNPNFHIDLPEGLLKVNCTEREAQKVNSFLYNTVYFSAWKYSKRGQKPTYYFCDHYIDITQYNEYKSFYVLNDQTEGTLRFHQIHDKLVELIQRHGISSSRKIIRLYKNENVENGKIRTILVTLKSFKHTNELVEIIEDLASILRNKLQQDTI